MALPLELLVEIYRSLFQDRYLKVLEEVKESVPTANPNNLEMFLQKGQQAWVRQQVSLEDMNITKQILWGKWHYFIRSGITTRATLINSSCTRVWYVKNGRWRFYPERFVPYSIVTIPEVLYVKACSCCETVSCCQ